MSGRGPRNPCFQTVISPGFPRVCALSARVALAGALLLGFVMMMSAMFCIGHVCAVCGSTVGRGGGAERRGGEEGRRGGARAPMRLGPRRPKSDVKMMLEPASSMRARSACGKASGEVYHTVDAPCTLAETLGGIGRKEGEERSPCRIERVVPCVIRRGRGVAPCVIRREGGVAVV